MANILAGYSTVQGILFVLNFCAEQCTQYGRDKEITRKYFVIFLA